MNNGGTIDFSNAVLFVDGVEIGKAKAISAEVKFDGVNERNVNQFNFSKEFSSTLEVSHIETENPIIKSARLSVAISYYIDVVYYARHSKKKHVAIRKLNKLIDEYNQLKGNNG